MHRLATGNAADRDVEVRRPPAPPADGGRLDHVDTGRQVSLDTGVEVGPAVIVVRDAAAVLGQQVDVRVGPGGHQVDPDPSCLGDPEPVGVGVAAGAETRITVLGRPTPGRRQRGPGGAQRPEFGHLAAFGLLRQQRAGGGEGQQAGYQREGDRHQSQMAQSGPADHDSLHLRTPLPQAATQAIAPTVKH